MERPLTIAMVVGAFGGLIALTGSCLAQTITIQDGTQNQSPQNPQNPQASQVQPPLPRLGVPGSIITPPTTPGLKGVPLTSSLWKIVGHSRSRASWYARRTPLKSSDGCSGRISQLYASSGDWSFVLRPVN